MKKSIWNLVELKILLTERDRERQRETERDR